MLFAFQNERGPVPVECQDLSQGEFYLCTRRQLTTFSVELVRCGNCDAIGPVSGDELAIGFRAAMMRDVQAAPAVSEARPFREA